MQKAKKVLRLIIFMIALDLILLCKYKKAKTKMQGFLFNRIFVIMLTLTVFPITESWARTVHVQPLLTDLNNPWSIKTDDYNRFWITLMSGELVIVEDDIRQKVPLKLDNLLHSGQGGLLDIILVDVRAERVHAIVSYAQGDTGANRLAIASIVLIKTDNIWEVTQTESVFVVKNDKGTPVHYAGRLLLLPDNTLLVNSGDGFDYREDAQRTSSQLGKTLRMNLDGTPVSDPPFADNHYLFSLGHRNAQGLALDSLGRIWQHEHGPAGGDEINLLESGANYGWPIVTRGKDYSGALISPITQAEGMTPPKVNWTPSIAPSSMVYYGFDTFPELTGNLLIGTLKTKTIHAINIHDDYRETILTLPISERIRDLTMTNKGDVLVLTDGGDASVLLLTLGTD